MPRYIVVWHPGFESGLSRMPLIAGLRSGWSMAGTDMLTRRRVFLLESEDARIHEAASEFLRKHHGIDKMRRLPRLSVVLVGDRVWDQGDQADNLWETAEKALRSGVERPDERPQWLITRIECDAQPVGAQEVPHAQPARPGQQVGPELKKPVLVLSPAERAEIVRLLKAHVAKRDHPSNTRPPTAAPDPGALVELPQGIRVIFTREHPPGGKTYRQLSMSLWSGGERLSFTLQDFDLARSIFEEVAGKPMERFGHPISPYTVHGIWS